MKADFGPPERVRFAVVLNDLPSDVPSPADIGTGWLLQRATTQQIDEFRADLHRSHVYASRPFQEITALTDPDRLGTRSDKLDDANPENWRYWIARPSGLPNPAPTGRLYEALRLSIADIILDCWAYRASEPGQEQWGLVRNPSLATTFFSDELFGDRAKPVFTLDEVQRVLALRTRFPDEEFPEIIRCIELFLDLDAVASRSPMKLLGYFAVLEGLLSHAPSSNDSIDTITRQLRRNLLTIDHRLATQKAMGFEQFKDVTPHQVISHLYGYRSALAHGGSGETARKWLDDRWVGTPNTWQWLHQFMRRLVQLALQAALAEPRLITDLRGD